MTRTYCPDCGTWLIDGRKEQYCPYCKVEFISSNRQSFDALIDPLYCDNEEWRADINDSPATVREYARVNAFCKSKGVNPPKPGMWRRDLTAYVAALIEKDISDKTLKKSLV